jgi:hypothetical protein
MSKPAPVRNALGSRSLALLVVFGLLAPLIAEAQSGGYKRRSANGREFPTWEGEDELDLKRPLPQARQGRHVVDLSIPLDEPASGVVRLSDGSLLVALLDGRVQRFSLGGEQLSELSLADAGPSAPIAWGPFGLVVAGRTLSAVGAEGLAWELELEETPVRRPVLTRAGLAITLPDGRVSLVDPESGRVTWSVPVEGAACGPAQSRNLLVWGTGDGRLVGLDAADGSQRWEVAVADSIASVGADEESVFFSGTGETGRSRKSRGPFVARLSVAGKQPRVAWRSRVGGSAVIALMPIDEVVAFACFDGYVHAHVRGNGALAWRTDLPSRVTEEPRLFGGRLDYLLPLTGWAVAIAADNGGVMGYTELSDPDETFIGPPVVAGGYTIAATSFGRLVGLRWEYEPKAANDG